MIDLSAIKNVPVQNTAESISVWGYVGFGLIMLIPVVIFLFIVFKGRISAFLKKKMNPGRFFFAVFHYPNGRKDVIPAVLNDEGFIRFKGGLYMINKDAFNFYKPDLLSSDIASQEWFVGNSVPISFIEPVKPKVEKDVTELQMCAADVVDVAMSNKWMKEIIQGAKERILLLISVLLNVVIIIILIVLKYSESVPK